MKNKTFTIISAIVLLMLSSCSKQENMSNEKAQKMNDDKVYTIVAQFDAQENGSKTTIDTVNHNATAWVLEDKIWLHNGNTDGVGEVTQIQDGKAVITTSLDISAGTLYAVYPSPEGYNYQTSTDCPYSITDEGTIKIVIPTAQDGVFAKAHICAAIMKENKLTFKNAITLMKVKGIKEGSGIDQFVFPRAGGTITFDPASAEISVLDRKDVTVNPVGNGPYYVAVAPTIVYEPNEPIANYNKDTKVEYVKRAKTKTPLLRSRVYNLGEAPGSAWPYDAIPGEFTVDAQGHKVCFSKGNLYCHRSSTSSDWQWGFYDQQYKINKYFLSGSGSYTVTNDDLETDAFCWGYNPVKSVQPLDFYDSDADDRWSVTVLSDWGQAFGENSTWRTLTNDELNYILNFKLTSGAKTAQRYYKVQLTNSLSMQIQGVLLLPDNTIVDIDIPSWGKITVAEITLNSSGINDLNDTNFKILENLGAVFMPALSNRDNESHKRTLNYSVWQYMTASCPTYSLNSYQTTYIQMNFDRIAETTYFKNFASSVRLVSNIGW